MKDSKQIINQLAQGLAPSQKTSTTPAGPSDDQQSAAQQRRQDDQAITAEHIDAINQVFALFRINYHNQYHSAFSDSQVLNQAKKLWCESLVRFERQTILQGAKVAIEQSDYLPTLHKMIGYCQNSQLSDQLPEVHQAYLEACRAPSPKAGHNWSHPAVYHAGRDSDWYFLANNPEHVTFPVFKENYQALVQRVLTGETLQAPTLKKLPASLETPLSKEENLSRLQQLRKDMQL